MKIRAGVLGAAALVVCSCADVVRVTPPTPARIEKTREIAAPFDVVWLRAVDWFATSNITIEKIEKPSGLITAKYALSANSEYLDCGNIDLPQTLHDPDIDRRGPLEKPARRQAPQRQISLGSSGHPVSGSGAACHSLVAAAAFPLG